MSDRTPPAPPTEQQLDEIEARAARHSEYATQHDGEGDTLAGTDVPLLLAEVYRQRAELIDLQRKLAHAERIGESADFHLGQEMARRQLAEKEAEQLRAALTAIRHLHKDSPMGPCPVCIDADAAAAGCDGLMPYPCPTGRLAGAQDLDPPSFRTPTAVVPSATDDPHATPNTPSASQGRTGAL